ncbi:hypothetical protein BGX28_001509, partial [Mortierella sp. GBA30]
MLRDYFVAGLVRATQIQVEVSHPKSWQDAISVAERVNSVYLRFSSNLKADNSTLSSTSHPTSHTIPTSVPITSTQTDDYAMDIDN